MTISKQDLMAFCGTESYYKGLGSLLYTDGIQYLCENAGAYWLTDLVASYQPKLRQDERLMQFQLWRLEVRPNHTAVVTCRGDSDEPPVVSQMIEYTDFPLDLSPFEFYVEGLDQPVMLLPSEH